jgi:hypothetical protein
MSKLIDEIVFNGIKCDTEINGVWYCCKPLGVRKLKYRIVEAWKLGKYYVEKLKHFITKKMS